MGKKTRIVRNMDKQEDTQKQQAKFWLDYSQQLSTAIRYVEALAAAERAVRLDETSAETHYVRGTCQAMLAHYDEALLDFDAALRLDATYVPAWDGKAWVLGIKEQKAEALAAINKALELDPEYFEALKRRRRLEAM
jgi:tetratricopeptide (TPR) repeat protein